MVYLNFLIDIYVKQLYYIIMNEERSHTSIIEKFGRIINKFNYIEKIPRDFGTGKLLYPSEIHLIETIGKTPGINVTELAKKHGISKAAISQKLKKLEKKDLVERFKDSENEKAVLLKLTTQGKIAFKGHERFHSIMDSGIIQKINEMPPAKRKDFERILDEIDVYADSFINM